MNADERRAYECAIRAKDLALRELLARYTELRERLAVLDVARMPEWVVMGEGDDRRN